MRHDVAGWVGVAAVVLVADYFGERTMSDLFAATAHHPVGCPVLIIAWATLTAHLFGLIPSQYDPVDIAFSRVKRARLCLPW